MYDRAKMTGAARLKEAFSENAEEIFCAAMEIEDLGERQAFLKRACTGNARLLSQVTALISAQADVEQFFGEGSPVLSSDEPKAVPPDDPGLGKNIASKVCAEERPGTRIGPYRLLQGLGEGGCGAVYMAEQTRPVHRRVALKIIKLGMDTKSVIARFEAERQALALMDHPNIARVLDAGSTDTGRPYFVMELVRGVKLTTYCDQNQLDPRQRLNLFIQVCHAIQHAHQKGIIHRDIKPSNILVTTHDGVPMPMVIDFGIAKAVEGRLTDQTLFTPYEQFIGTPAYMSPEQAQMSRLDVDTRSDIYSLGVLLYEVLTGRTPFDSKRLIQSGLEEMRRTLRDTEPPRPSIIITSLGSGELDQTARFRHLEPPRLVSLLRGDLDWIVMKALEKDRNRRYQTANALAMDVQRYLDNEPVVARPPSQLYRLQKLVRRNRVFFVSAAAVVFALAIGLVVSTWLLLRARAAERDEARLRVAAERGLANEVELRHQVEGRAKIMQAAMLISQGAYADAEALIARLPVKQSTMEGADVFEKLGSWNVINGRWQAAEHDLCLLQRVSRIGIPTDVSLDWTKAAVVMIECNDLREYGRFCQDSINTFGSLEDPLVAGRILRNCLLVPTSATLISSLKPLAQCTEKSLKDVDFSSSQSSWQLSWRCEVMALWEYRENNPAQAIVWARRCLESQERVPTRDVSAQLILAMALDRLGKSEDAHRELQQARIMIETRFEKPLASTGPNDGAWFDWEIGRILLREAEASIEGKLGNSH